MSSNLDLHNVDCMEFLKDCEDNQFDLAIVDPPYGIGDKFRGGDSAKMNFNEIVRRGWDKAPTALYFNELFRVSMNQIIWGGNYFDLPPTRCFLTWDKKISQDFSLAMAEYAWTSFDALSKIFRFATPKGDKIHPTQKPVKLYKWLLTNYAKEGDKILDTHLGSGSIAIACHDMGFDLTACEIDKDYFEGATKRIEEHKLQYTMF